MNKPPFFSYNVDTDEMEMISTGTCPESAIPAVGHTQRATINQNRHEIHVMTVSLQFLTAILPHGLKGQLISKCLLGVIVSTKKPTKFL